MRTPRALRVNWREFDDLPSEIREVLRDELERYMASVDMLSMRVAFDDPHPNEDYEYEPLIAVKGNYQR